MFESSWLLGLHIPASLLPAPVLWVANGLFLVILWLAAKRSPIRQLLDHRPSQHVFFGAMVTLLMIWGIKAGISPGLGYHHLGATLFTLMFGWPLAIFGLTSVLLISILLPHSADSIELLSLGINGLLSIAVPVFTSYGILRLSEKYLPDNFFIYIFVVSFFGAGLAVATSRLAATLVLGLSGAYPDAKLLHESIMMLPLFMFPEMFVTGMLISIFVVYKPDWVLTFDDERYIIGK
jgi:uncharacterized membrane protein